MRVLLWLAKPKVQVYFNGGMCILWLIMLPVTLYAKTLQTAILYIALLSVWALFATHLGAWISALVNVKAERIDDRAEQNQHLARIEEAEDRIISALDSLAALVISTPEKPAAPVRKRAPRKAPSK